MNNLPDKPFVRLNEIIGDKNSEPPIEPLFDVSRSTWLAGVKAGIYPESIKLSKNISAWRVLDIRALIDRINSQGRP